MSAENESVRVLHESVPLPPEVPAAAEVYRQAREAGLQAVVVLSPSAPEARKVMAKRRHDIKAALRTLGFTLKALETGYRFQDDKAAAKIDAIAKAIQVLDKEGDLLARILAE